MPNTTTTVFCVYTGVLHPHEWMFRRPLLLKVLVKIKKVSKTKLSEKKNQLNNNQKIYYEKKT